MKMTDADLGDNENVGLKVFLGYISEFMQQ